MTRPWQILEDQDQEIDSDGNVGIGVTDPDSHLEIYGTSNQLKLSNNADDYATFAVGTHGDLTITTHDQAAGAANFAVVADGAVDIDANAGILSLDGSGGINIGTETDVAVAIEASTLAIDASDNTNITVSGITKTLDIDATGTVSIDSGTSITIGTAIDRPIDIDASTFELVTSDNLDITLLANNAADKTISIDAQNTGSGTASIQIGGGTSGTAISIGHTTSETTVNDNLTVAGNLTVNGTTTTINSSTLTVDDKNIELALVENPSNLTSAVNLGPDSIVKVADASQVIVGATLTKTSTGGGAFNAASVTVSNVNTGVTPHEITVSGGINATPGPITFSVDNTTDASADGGGITLKATADKEIKWVSATNRWTTNVGITSVATTAEQLRLAYDAGEFTTMTVDSSGNLTILADQSDTSSGNAVITVSYTHLTLPTKA